MRTPSPTRMREISCGLIFPSTTSAPPGTSSIRHPRPDIPAGRPKIQRIDDTVQGRAYYSPGNAVLKSRQSLTQFRFIRNHLSQLVESRQAVAPAHIFNFTCNLTNREICLLNGHAGSVGTPAGLLEFALQSQEPSSRCNLLLNEWLDDTDLLDKSFILFFTFQAHFTCAHPARPEHGALEDTYLTQGSRRAANRLSSTMTLRVPSRKARPAHGTRAPRNLRTQPTANFQGIQPQQHLSSLRPRLGQSQIARHPPTRSIFRYVASRITPPARLNR